MKNWLMKLQKLNNYLLPGSLIVVLIVGAFLRFFQIGSESYWLDEIVTVFTGQNKLSDIILHWNFDTPPFFYTLFHFWEKTFGTSEVATRSLSAVAGILAIIMIYLVGRELFNHKVGILSAILLALSESQIYASQEARFYSLLGLMTLISTFIYLRALKKGRWLQFLLLGLVNALLFFTHAFGSFIIAAQAIFFLLYWKKYESERLKWVIGQSLMGISIILALFFSGFGSSGISGAAYNIVKWIPEPNLASIFRTLYQYIFPLRHGRSWASLILSFGVGFLIILLGWGLSWLRSTKDYWRNIKMNLLQVVDFNGHFESILFVSCWLIVPILVPFILSKIFTPIYLDRYTSEAAPAFIIIISFLIFKVNKVIPEWVLLAGLLMMIIPGIANYYPEKINEDWQAATTAIQEKSIAGDVIIFAPDQDGYEKKVFNWYYAGNIPECSIDAELIDESSIGSALSDCISGANRFWLVMRGPTSLMEGFTGDYLPKELPGIQFLEEEVFTGIKVALYSDQP
jgi:mannosyltransferase